MCVKILCCKKFVYDFYEVQMDCMGYNSFIYGIMEKIYIKFIDVMIVENYMCVKYMEDLYGFYLKVIYNYLFVIRSEYSGVVNFYEKLSILVSELILLY